jgi:hypothetical protein
VGTYEASRSTVETAGQGHVLQKGTSGRIGDNVSVCRV